jgi:hypothetical protein
MTGRTARLLTVLAIAISACSVANRPADTTTTTPSGGEPPRFELSPAGLPPYRVGEPLAPLVAAMDEVFGGPDRETEWEPASSSVFGLCPGTEVRGVGWGTFYLIEQRTTAGEVFLTWTYGFDHERAESGDPRQLDLRTAEGIGLGSTRNELESAYGDRLAVTEDVDSGIVSFVVDGDETEHIRGRLSGAGANDTVDFLERAPGCE